MRLPDLISTPLLTSDTLLTPSERQHILEDIARISLVIAVEIAENASLGMRSTPSASCTFQSPLERIHLLEHLFNEAASAIRTIVRSPDSTPMEVRFATCLNRLHGSPQTITDLARQARNVLGADIHPLLPEDADTAIFQARIMTTARRITTVTPGIRMVHCFLREIYEEAMTLVNLADYTAEFVERDSMARIAALTQMWLSAPVFQLMSPRITELPSRLGTDPHIRASPAYRAILKSWQALHGSTGFDWNRSPAFSGQAIEPWHLYEIWCYLKTAECIHASGWRMVSSDFIKYEPRGLKLALVRGRKSRIEFRRQSLEAKRAQDDSGAPEKYSFPDRADLWYQPLFQSAEQFAAASASDPEGTQGYAGKERGRFRSLTHAMQPDIALRIDQRLFLLDPKYRGYHEDARSNDRPYDTRFEDRNAPMLKDIDKMHAYRDAIVTTITARRVVEEAWCLFPGVDSEDSRVIAYPTSAPKRGSGGAGIGALTLRPGGSSHQLMELISRWTAARKEKGPRSD